MLEEGLKKENLQADIIHREERLPVDLRAAKSQTRNIGEDEENKRWQLYYMRS